MDIGLLVFDALLVCAAVFDARERRLPNALAAALIAYGLAYLLVTAGFSLSALYGLGVSALCCSAPVGFEALWRVVRDEPGLGMGDVKLLFALMLVSPLRGILAFAAGLLLLALACLAARQRSLPLIPFIAACWIPLAFI